MYFKISEQEGKAILSDLAVELGCPDNLDRAYRTLKSVLSAFRNKLYFQKSLDLLNALPLSLKSIYVDHWLLSQQQSEITPDLDEVIAEARRIDKRSSIQDFTTTLETQLAIFSVFKVIEGYVNQEDFKLIMVILTDTKTIA